MATCSGLHYRAGDTLTSVLQRKDLYDLSDPVSPLARVHERQVMLDLLGVEPHHQVVDVPAWAGYLAEGITNIANPKQIMCVEPSPRFAAGIPEKFTRRCIAQTTIPTDDASIDRLGSMVGMHHLDDKLAFVTECARVLKPGGRIVLSEVVEDSLVAKFLNGPVDKYTTNGHKGMFVKLGELRDLLSAAGFTHVDERFYHVFWQFGSLGDMARFARGLLGLAKATEEQTLQVIRDHFEIDIHFTSPGTFEPLRDAMEAGDVRAQMAVPCHVALPWSLVYAVGVRSVSRERS
jgi:ubiquinone/menaquinone biosynthesis C-methylase UbiE